MNIGAANDMDTFGKRILPQVIQELRFSAYCARKLQTRPQFLAKLFKVPHHGSSNGQSIEVWTKMLENAGPPACRSTRSFR